ncbi:hypothetical protein F4803DRAFT_541256 [Xylaria telfairii]|nr:hypothetical protein F4803DRAFT_541256 [Xylaria telfairii]
MMADEGESHGKYGNISKDYDLGEQDYNNNNEVPDDLEDVELSPILPGDETTTLQPTIDPQTRISQGRISLIDRISQDVDTEWEDEKKWKDGGKYEQYRHDVDKLLQDESLHLGETSSDSDPINFLQFVLQKAPGFVPYPKRIYKAKFLVSLIAELDAEQLNPEWGPRPLHIAADFDVKRFKEDNVSKSDLTKYTSSLMTKELAATAIAECNKAGENILHLAILNDIEGAEHLIQLAGTQAFQKRRSKEGRQGSQCDDDGNTPLHDALHIRNFMGQAPECSAPRSAANASNNKTQEQQVVNQGKLRNMSRCTTCSKAYSNLAQLNIKRQLIINLLLKQYEQALMIPNSHGLSPYLYLLQTQKSADTTESRRPSDPPNHTRPPAPSSVASQDRQLELRILGQQGTKEDTKNRDLPNAEENERLDKMATKKGFVREAGINHDGLVGGPHDSAGTHRAGRTSAKTKPMLHQPQDLTTVRVGFDKVSRDLKERAFRLGGYKNAYKCLFRDPTGKPVSSSKREITRMRKFSLKGNQRVSASTVANFDFLLFEETMASIVLSLEYPPALLKALPVDETERTKVFQKDEGNLKAVFKWLKLNKGVKSIVQLIVKENPHHYCSDDTIEECLKHLDVRYLNWNRPDLCAETLRVVPSLIEVSLTWSGLNAVLWSWSDTHGLQTLKKLEKVHLYIQRGLEPHQKQDKKVERFQERVSKWNRGDEFAFPRLIIIPRNDDSQLKRDGSGAGLGSNFEIPLHSWLKTASNFADQLISEYPKLEPKSHYHIKVAVLDDGVDPTYGRLGSTLHYAGWPTIDSGESDDGEGSFYVSTNQHGSKMAYLIHQVCPFVTIYVAKLDVTDAKSLRHRTFDLKQATKAIEWATGQEVDIISMSWNARRVSGHLGNDQEIRAMEKAISDAASDHILMFGAACDVKESALNEQWYPCDSPNVNSIGATDIDFDVKKYVDLDKVVNYLFPGEHLFSQPGDQEVGNSGATALATGLAALVLFCMKISKEPIPEDRLTWMNNVMAHVFRSQAERKVVHVKDVLKMDDKERLKPLVNKFAAQRG